MPSKTSCVSYGLGLGTAVVIMMIIWVIAGVAHGSPCRARSPDASMAKVHAGLARLQSSLTPR